MSVPKPDLIYDRFRVVTLAGRVASAIKAYGMNFHGIVPVAFGGLAHGLLLEELTGIPIIDVMRLRRYEDDEKKSAIEYAKVVWTPDPENIRNKNLVLAEDVLDIGYSVVRGTHMLFHEMEAAVVRTALLDAKRGPRETHFPTLKPDFVGEMHEGAPWIQYPWEVEGATHETELLMFVTMGHLKREKVDRVLKLVREREAKAKIAA